MRRIEGPGTITKCLSLGHFARFPQVDVRKRKWHFIHPLTKVWDPGQDSTASVIVQAQLGQEWQQRSGISEGEMGAANRATPIRSGDQEAAKATLATPLQKVVAEPVRVPALRVAPLLTPGQPRRFVRVPTHAVGVNHEQREYPRASLKLPLRLRSVGSRAEEFPVTLVTRDISSTGVFFLCPKEIAMGAQIELEIVLVSRPLGHGSVVIVTTARVQRIEPAAMPGWYGIAGSFDDVHFDRDDGMPSRFLRP